MRSCLLPLALAVLTGCPECVPEVGGDGGPDGGGGSSGGTSSSSGGGTRDGGRRDGGDGGTGCGPDTPGFGEPCGECGARVCGRTGALTCQDPGKNACDACGDLDTANGIVGRACGTCGVVGCADGGLATLCQGEHAPNECGGCGTFPVGRGPPDAGCSACGTGTWACQVSRDDLSCWGGRGETGCGGCARCVVMHAPMADLGQGAFIRAGTVAVVEDVGEDPDMGTSAGRTHLVTFDPLVVGPGAAVLEGAAVYLSPSEQHTDPLAFALLEFFSAYSFGQPGDPVRQYHVPYPLEGMTHLIVFDSFLGTVVSRGRLVPGPPPPGPPPPVP